jgi:hypothetical protein
MAIDHHDLVGAGCPGAAHGRVDLLGIELAALFVQWRATIDLLPNHNTAYTFHVGHD